MQVKMIGGGTVTNRMSDKEPYAIISSFRVSLPLASTPIERCLAALFFAASL